MSSCDTCRAPGNCCSGFVLNHPFPGANWKADAEQLLADAGLQFFKPVRQFFTSETEWMDGVMFDCSRLGADGRCTDYENRPQLCRAYQAGDDALCAEFVQTLKGIPIRVQH